MTVDHIKATIRDIPDFPKPGILFKDITPMLQDPKVFRDTIDVLYERYAKQHIDKIVAIESRGFVFASPLSYRLGAGLVPMRKPGKLPYDTISQSYLLEYGESTLEMHKDAINDGERVLIVDDLLATGGTAAASVALVRKMGGEVVETSFVIELLALKGRDKLADTPVYSMLQF